MPYTDERIVSMKFDNAQFENGVSTSIKSIDKLNKALKFEGVSDSFDQISRAARKVDLSGAQSNVDSFLNHLSIQSIAKISVISNLIQDVYQKGKKLINDIFVAPKKDGFNEYELKMGSVQTIMASTGAELDTVNDYLAELNTYADRTIYSFKDMTASIGKFTNAGVKLEDAVMAIKGISNEAAVSGANANEASRAMYNFAQALSAGYVKLIDWKSIENANMATKEFKQELIDSAVSLGTVVKEGDKYRSVTTDLNGKVSELFTSTSMFNDSLSSQWMTTDVLVKTLARYADETTDIGKKAYAAAQEVKTFSQLMDTFKEALGSGWSQTFEIVIGDFNEAKELFTTISGLLDHITSIAFSVQNGLLQMWKDNGGRDKIIKDIKTITENLTTLSDKVVKTVLGPKYAKFIDQQSESTDKLSKSVEKYSAAEMEAARTIWYGENKYGNGEERVKNLEAAGLNAQKVQEYVDKLSTSGWSFDEAVEQASQSLETVVDESKNAEEEIGWNNWAKSFDYIVTTLKMVATGIGNLGSVVLNVAKNIIEPFIEEFDLSPITWDIKEIAKRFMVLTGRAKDGTKRMDGLRNVISVVAKLINAIYDFLKPGIKFLYDSLFKIANFIGKIVGAIDKFLGNKNTYSKVILIWELLATIFNNIKSSIKGVIGVFDEYIKKSSNPTLKKIVNFFNDTKNVVGKLLDSGLDKVIALLSTLATSGFGKFKIKGVEQVAKVIGGIKDKISEVVGMVYGNIKQWITGSGDGTSIFEKMIQTVKNTFSDTETKQKAFDWISGILGKIVDGFKNFDFSKLIEMLKIGILLYTLYATHEAMKKITAIADTFKGAVIGVINGITGVLTQYQNKLKADSLKTIAQSILIISGSLMLLSQVPQEQLYGAAFAIGIVLGAISLLIKAMSLFQKAKPNVEGDKIIKVLDGVRLNLADLGIAAYSTAATIFAFAFALKQIVETIMTLKDLTGGEILVNAILILGALIALVGAVQLLSDVDVDAGTVASVLAIGLVLKRIASALATVSKLDPLKALGAWGILTLSMLSISAMLNTIGRMANGSAFLKASAGIVILSVALNALIPLVAALTGLAALDMDAFGAAIGSLAGLLLVVSLVAMAISVSNAEKSLIALGVGIAAMAGGLAIFGALGLPAVAGLIVLAGALLVVAVGAGIIKACGLTPTLIEIAAALVAFSTAAIIFGAAVFLCAAAIKIMADNLPKLGISIIEFASTLSGNVKILTAGITAVIKSVCMAIVNSASDIALALITIVSSSWEAMKKFIKNLWGPFSDLVYDTLNFLLTLLPEISNMLVSALVTLVNSVAVSISDTSGPFSKALWNLIDSVLVLVLEFLTEGMRRVSIIPDSWIDDLEDTVDDLREDISESTEELSKDLSKLGEKSGEALGDGVKEGVKKTSTPDSVYKAFQFDQLKLKIQKEQGGMLDISSFISNNPGKLEDYAKEMGLDLGSGISEGMTEADLNSMFAEMGMELPEAYAQPEAYESVSDINTDAFQEAARDRFPQTKEEGAEMSKEGAEGAETTLPLYKDAAHYLVTGFANEIRAGRMRVYAVGKVLAAAAKNAIDDYLEIESPSKATGESGMYTVLGFVKGIEDYIYKAEDAGEELGEDTLNIMKGPIDRILEMLNGNLEYDPTIRPILDTSLLESGMQTANGLFGGTSYRLGSSISGYNRAVVDASSADIKMGSPDVVQAINELRGDFNEMSSKLDQMQVVMDTGALVGTMVAPMDEALGRRQIYRGRGN